MNHEYVLIVSGGVCGTVSPRSTGRGAGRRSPRWVRSRVNWSTSRRRWVRIRTPVMRAASTNPAAAIVLPDAVGMLEPVAAAGARVVGRLGLGLAVVSSPSPSSGSSPSSASSSSSSSSSSPFSDSSSSSSSKSSVSVSGAPARLGLAGVVGQGRRCIVVVAVAVAVAVLDRRARLGVLPVALGVAEQGGEHAGEGVDLVRAQLEAVGQVRLVLGQDPLQAQHEREPAPPRGRRRCETGVDLEQRLVVGRAERGAGRKRHDGVVAHRDEAIASPPLDSLELGRLNAWILRCLGGDLFGQPRTSV